jgi:transcriptional regulator with XRE-family HTH domain
MGATDADAQSPFWVYFRAELDRRRMTMTEFAKLSGVRVQAIYKWKESKPNPESCRKVAAALGEDPEHLLVLAGHLDPRGEGSAPGEIDVEAAIWASTAFTKEQKQLLVATAREFRRGNAE